MAHPAATLVSVIIPTANRPALLRRARWGDEQAFALLYHYLPDRRVHWRQAFAGGVLGVAGHTWIAFFFFWGVQVYFIIAGLEGIKWLASIAAPLSVVVNRLSRDRVAWTEPERILKASALFLISTPSLRFKSSSAWASASRLAFSISSWLICSESPAIGFHS